MLNREFGIVNLSIPIIVQNGNAYKSFYGMITETENDITIEGFHEKLSFNRSFVAAVNKCIPDRLSENIYKLD